MGGQHKPSSGTTEDFLDLAVIDQAFGDFADLYSDVLRVSVAATPEQIQLAYFDRRSELFTLLAKIDAKQPQTKHTASDRFHTERKMDSVVLAVRILGDPTQRLRYDRMRQERLLNRRRAQQGQLPGYEPPPNVSSFDTSGDMVHVIDKHGDYNERQNHKESKRRSSKHQKSQNRNDRKHRRQMEIEVMEQTPPSPTQRDKEGGNRNSRSSWRSGSNRKEDKPDKRKRKHNKGGDKHQQQVPVVTPTHEDQVRMRATSSDAEETEPNTTDEDSATAEREPPRGRSRRRAGSEDKREVDDVDDAANKSGCLQLFKSSKSQKNSGDNSSIERSGALSCFSNSRILKKISDEISGACEDTLVSVDQVFNAFTLTDKDIRAVTKRIDKAKHMLH